MTPKADPIRPPRTPSRILPSSDHRPWLDDPTPLRDAQPGPGRGAPEPNDPGASQPCEKFWATGAKVAFEPIPFFREILRRVAWGVHPSFGLFDWMATPRTHLVLGSQSSPGRHAPRLAPPRGRPRTPTCVPSCPSSAREAWAVGGAGRWSMIVGRVKLT